MIHLNLTGTYHENIHIMKTYVQPLGEFIYENSFQMEEDSDDRITIHYLSNNIPVGKVILVPIWEPFEHELDGEYTEDEYSKIFNDVDFFMKIEHLEVNNEIKGSGIAKKLMKKAISYCKKKNVEFIYLNASPMGFSGLQIHDLTKFYEKFGFKNIKDQGHNVQMVLKNKK